jgi:SET domain-containing protein
VRELPEVIEVRRSEIHGYGVFATRRISYGEIIPSPHTPNVKGWRKFRGFNRSCYPNAIIQDEVHALRIIERGEEITFGYIVESCRCPAHHV